MKWAIVDIDGTLSNQTHRLAYALAARESQGEARQDLWRKFHGLCAEDPLNLPEAELVRAWAALGNGVIYVTGRPDVYREATREWLSCRELPMGPLYMRPAKTFDWSANFKSRMLDHIKAKVVEPGDLLVFAMDDDDGVVAMYRSRGLTCFQSRHATA